MKKFLIIILFLPLFIWSQQDRQEEQTLHFDEFFYDAMNERLKDNFKKSNELFEQCLLIDEQNDVIYFKMAQNHFDLKEYNQALLYVEKAQKINPNNKWYEKLRIEIKIKNNAPKEEVIKMIQAFESSAQNKYIIQDLYKQIKRHPKIAEQTKNTKIKKTLSREIQRLSDLITARKFDKAVDLSEKLLTEQPENAQLYLLSAKAYIGLKNYTEALDFLDMGMDFILNDTSLKKSFYQQYIVIYTHLNNPKKKQIYQNRLQKL